MNGIAGMLLTLQIQAEQRQKNEEEAEEQSREQEGLKRRRQNKEHKEEHKEEQETKELVILRNGKEIPAHQVLDTDAVVITQDAQGNFVRSYETFEKH